MVDNLLLSLKWAHKSGGWLDTTGRLYQCQVLDHTHWSSIVSFSIMSSINVYFGRQRGRRWEGGGMRTPPNKRTSLQLHLQYLSKHWSYKLSWGGKLAAAHGSRQQLCCYLGQESPSVYQSRQ